jgi:hypothetical protein
MMTMQSPSILSRRVNDPSSTSHLGLGMYVGTMDCTGSDIDPSSIDVCENSDSMLIADVRNSETDPVHIEKFVYGESPCIMKLCYGD